MSEERHTPEPWAVDIRMGCAAITIAGAGLNCLSGKADEVIAYQDGRGERAGGDGTGYRVLTPEQVANFVRIGAAVNACAGIPTAALQANVLQKAKEMLRVIVAELPGLDWTGALCCPFCVSVAIGTPQPPCETRALLAKLGQE